MTTTYELYTNENGTPKAVEGKAPAIIERVETLETNVKTLDGDIKTLDGDIKTLDEDVGNIQTAIEVLEDGVVKTINGETPDQAGNIDIPVGHNVGEEWISYTGKIPKGGVPYCGQTVTRATYADLWAYAQAQGLVKTESEWQSWASSHGGNVPYYSSGDGSTTFRMPKLVGYVKGASSQSESGSYVAEGLPDHYHIQGGAVNNTANVRYGMTDTGVSGGIYDTGSGTTLTNGINTSGVQGANSIYGNSSHVTPETSVVLFGVYAFGEITNQGALDAETLAAGLATVEANALAKSQQAEIVGWSFPGNKRVDLAIGASNSSYVAPADGWFYVVMNLGANKYVLLINDSTMLSTSFLASATFNARIFLPVKKGETVRLLYTSSPDSSDIFRFIYASGES